MKPQQRKELFAFVFDRDGGCCVYCGVPVRPLQRGLHRAPDLATLDHIVPRSQGGRLTRDNLVLACRACNNARGDEDAAAFRERLRSAEASGRAGDDSFAGEALDVGPA